MNSTPPPLVALYVPGDRPDRFDKAVASGTDIVILDLEDAVAAGAKEAAREHVLGWLDAQPERLRPAIQVRINPAATQPGRSDLAALPSWVPVRVPKVDDPDCLRAVANRPVHALIETALGVENAYRIARHPAVRTLALGEADLHAELGTAGDEAMAWIRSRLVVAARAAGLPAPMMPVYPAIADRDGLARSCAFGRRLGMRGRAAVHPSQIPIIREAFQPSESELRWARQVLAALARGDGVATLADGSMVDEAMARAARTILTARR